MDLAIIGGGVAGCYCAFRLAHDSNLKSVELFEASDRIGGRLWSVIPKGSEGVEGLPIELGGNWFGTGHKNVFRLTEKLGLAPTKLEWTDKLWFLRGVDLTECDFKAPEGEDCADPNKNCCPKAPYRLPKDEQCQQPLALLELALERILGRSVNTLWPRAGTPHDTLRHLRSCKPLGRELWRWGFWNLLAEVVSPEAYELMLAGVGLTSTFRNTNAYDAIWVALFEGAMGVGPYRLPNGYQSLPEKLEEECRRKVHFHKEHRLKRIERRGRVLKLHFDGDRVYEARRVILAMPRRALQLIDMDHNVVDEKDFNGLLDAVLPVPACKLYLLFDRPWWTDKNVGAGRLTEHKVIASYTDLPMRQCCYFRDSFTDEKALVMACYADHVATSFWSVLAETTGDESASQNWLMKMDVPRGPPAMVHAARQQLSAMHNGMPVPETEWAPHYWDWGKDPYGAAWHAWAPHCKSWEVRKNIRQPNTKIPLYTCGEAFAQLQGWAEGAIRSAEMALRHASKAPTAPFDLDYPEWVDLEPEFEV